MSHDSTEPTKAKVDSELLREVVHAIALYGPDSDGVKALMEPLPPHVHQLARWAQHLWTNAHGDGFILPYTMLPTDVQVAFCFGKKEVTHKGLRYTFVDQPAGEASRYRVTATEETDVPPSD